MRSILSLFITSLMLSFHLSAGECEILFQQMPTGNYLKNIVEISTELKVKNKLARNIIKEAVKKRTGKVFEGNTFEEAIEEVYQAVKLRGDLTDVQKANEIAKFGNDINPVFEAMVAKFPVKGTIEKPNLKAWVLRKEAIDEVKTVKFKLSRKISELESFKRSEYKNVEKHEFVITRGNIEKEQTHLQLGQYKKYVKSWVYFKKNPATPEAKLFDKIDQGSLGVLSIGDIRDITSYNLWPMYLKEHDMRHVHFAYSHPMAIAAMFGTTRSKNNTRYVLMAGLYEGVDRVQYSHETLLNKFFSEKIKSEKVFGINRNLDLEEAMLTIAIASDDDIKNLQQLSEVGELSWLLTGLDDWRPKIVTGSNYNGVALSGKNLDEEIDDIIARYKLDARKSEKMKRKLLDDQKMELSSDDEILLKMTNYQLEPENPEIVIDGIRFKNDGRGHYSWDFSDTGGGDGPVAPIGIGDQ